MDRVTLADVMTRDFVGVSESDDLRATVSTMREAGESHAVVLRGQEPVGIVTAERALDHFVSGSADDASVADVMASHTPSLRPEANVEDAREELSRADTTALVVADGDGVVGLVSATDLLSAPRQPSQATPAVAGPGEESGAVQRDVQQDEAVDSFAAQSICEACGSLARNLTDVNGQLLCPECRDV